MSEAEMTSIKALIVSGICLLAFAAPTLGGDSWSALKTYGPALEGFANDLRTARLRAAAELPPKNPGIEVVELPTSFSRVKVPGILAPVMATYEGALTAIRQAAKTDPKVAAALRARALDIDDVVAVGKTENGSLKILVEAT
jgi:hypothetical protein